MSTHPTRRTFLKTSMTTAAGVVILRDSRSAHAYVANEKLRIAAIGVCGQGRGNTEAIGLAGLLLMAVVGWGSLAGAADAPTIFWASDPVRPGETVVVQGGNFGDHTVVETARLEDAHFKDAKASSPTVKDWVKVEPLQKSACSLKFIVPAQWKMGVFVCRIIADGVISKPYFINVPDGWWMQADGGQTASPSGWLRVFGKSLNFRGKSRAALKPETGKAIILPASNADCYALRFEIPKNLRPGNYEVLIHNGLGGEAAWRKSGAIEIKIPAGWPEKVFNVAEILKTTQGDAEKALRQALALARKNGGGIVYLPAGRYSIKGNIAIPPRTVIEGDGMDKTSLRWLDFFWPDSSVFGQAVAQNGPLVGGKDFAVQDLTMLYGGIVNVVIADTRDSETLRLNRIRVQRWRVPTNINKEALSTGGVVQVTGKNFSITDSDFQTRWGIAVEGGSHGIIARNKFMARESLFPMGITDGIIIEENECSITGYSNINGAPYSQNLYFAHNRLSNNHFAEFFTFDGTGGCYLGKPEKVEGARLVLAEEPTAPGWWPLGKRWIGAAVCIVDGKGAGQYRRVVSNDVRIWEVDRPWDIDPDQTSLISIVPFRGRVLFIGNELKDGGIIQSYGTSIDCIFADNRTRQVAGFLTWARNMEGASCQPSFYCQFFDNDLVDGSLLALGLDKDSSGKNTPYSGPMTRCSIYRRNVIRSNGGIRIDEAVTDALVENTSISHGDWGIKIGARPSNVLLRNNVFNDVTKPLDGEGIKKALIKASAALPDAPYAH